MPKDTEVKLQGLSEFNTTVVVTATSRSPGEKWTGISDFGP